MVKKTNKKELENKAILEIIVQGLLQALVMSLIILLMFGDGNATIVAVLDAIKQAKVSAWEIAVVVFPMIFVACTAVQLAAYIVKGGKK